jgi:hypothetical protein
LSQKTHRLTEILREIVDGVVVCVGEGSSRRIEQGGYTEIQYQSLYEELMLLEEEYQGDDE